jgi:hypothetical protein
MINIIYAVRMPLPIQSTSQHTRQSLDPCIDGSQVQISSFFKSEFKFLLMHESNFHVTGFSYGSNTRDAMVRVSRSRADIDVDAITASNWILATIASS